MTRRDLRTSEAEWRATPNAAIHRTKPRRRRMTFGTIIARLLEMFR